MRQEFTTRRQLLTCGFSKEVADPAYRFRAASAYPAGAIRSCEVSNVWRIAGFLPRDKSPDKHRRHLYNRAGYVARGCPATLPAPARSQSARKAPLSSSPCAHLTALFRGPEHPQPLRGAQADATPIATLPL